MAKLRVPLLLKGSGRRQESAPTASAIHSTKVATLKEMSILLERMGRRRFQFRELMSPLFRFVWWKTSKERDK